MVVSAWSSAWLPSGFPGWKEGKALGKDSELRTCKGALMTLNLDTRVHTCSILPNPSSPSLLPQHLAHTLGMH